MTELCNRDSHRALIGLCGFGGLRIHEALATRPSWFDSESRALMVYGKGSKVRYVPVSTELARSTWPAIIESFSRGNDDPIVGLNDRVARRLITSLGERAKVSRPVKSHDLRATFATELYNATKDAKLVSEVLGHASVVTTQVYIETKMEQMRNAIKLISK